MNVTGSSANYGQEAMIASLSKKQQEAQGKQALELLQGAVQTAQSTHQAVMPQAHWVATLTSTSSGSGIISR